MPRLGLRSFIVCCVAIGTVSGLVVRQYMLNGWSVEREVYSVEGFLVNGVWHRGMSSSQASQLSYIFIVPLPRPKNVDGDEARRVAGSLGDLRETVGRWSYSSWSGARVRRDGVHFHPTGVYVYGQRHLKSDDCWVWLLVPEHGRVNVCPVDTPGLTQEAVSREVFSHFSASDPWNKSIRPSLEHVLKKRSELVEAQNSGNGD